MPDFLTLLPFLKAVLNFKIENNKRAVTQETFYCYNNPKVFFSSTEKLSGPFFPMKDQLY